MAVSSSRVVAACVAWTLRGAGFQDEFMRELLGRNWHSLIRRAAVYYGDPTQDEIDRAIAKAEGRDPEGKP